MDRWQSCSHTANDFRGHCAILQIWKKFLRVSNRSFVIDCGFASASRILSEKLVFAEQEIGGKALWSSHGAQKCLNHKIIWSCGARLLVLRAPITLHAWRGCRLCTIGTHGGCTQAASKLELPWVVGQFVDVFGDFLISVEICLCIMLNLLLLFGTMPNKMKTAVFDAKMEAPLLVETCSRFTYVTIKEWLHATLGVQPTEFFSLPYRLEFHISTQRSDLCGLHQHQGVVEYHISGKKSAEQVCWSPVAFSSAYVWAIHIACGCLWLMVLNSGRATKNFKRTDKH